MLVIRGLSVFHSGRLAPPARAVRACLPPVNFITLHYAYFIVTCLVSAVIFWGASTPAKSISFTDSLFLCVSAMSLAGLNTINLSTANTFQQSLLFLLIMLGSAIFVSAFVVHVRKRAFERKFRDIANERMNKHERSRNLSWSMHTFTRTASDNRSEDLAHHAPPGPAAGTGGMSAFRSHRRQQGSTTTPPVAQTRPRTPRSQHRSPSKFALTHGNSSTIEDDDDFDADQDMDRITFGPDTHFHSPTRSATGSPRRRHRSSFIAMQGVGAAPIAGLHLFRSSSSVANGMHDDEKIHMPPNSTDEHLPSSGHISRNSQFHGLTDAERVSLGGVEYKALYWLSWLVPLYYIFWQLFGCIGLAAWVASNRPATARQNGLNPWWVGAFNGVSAFNNSGMSLLDANMTAFQTSIYMLITMGLMILAGNTCYPIFLRLIIWTLRRIMPDNEAWAEHRSTLTFLLNHPRRCYTNLFPSQHTWWLLLAVFTLNGIDWAAFEILNIGNDSLNEVVSTNYRVIDGLFQAVAVRSGGFYVVAIPSLRISLQVLYVVMMYISVYPVVITMRNSNVYEERSLGIYSDDRQSEHHPSDRDAQGFWQGLSGFRRQLSRVQDSRSYFVSQQLRAQLAHDLWWLVLAIFLIMIIEGGQFERNPTTFSVFNVIFEVVSGYGTVGLSVGLPNEAYSFCGAWHKLSKLILCAVMIRGRHRGLPVAIDKAVLLPGEKLGQAEEEDAMIRMERGVSRSRADEDTV